MLRRSVLVAGILLLSANLSFRVKGTLPGTFVVPLRGVVDGGAWMDDLGMYMVVTVR